jgi:acetolactate synthase-1/2/3 large subunit
MSKTLVAAIASAGVKRIFTLSGNHVMPVFDAARDAGLELVHVRHEAAAVHMADAWARLTGEVGIALVTGGPGHANAVGALYTARMAESPVVLLSGHAPMNELGRGSFQEMAQAEMAAPACKRSWMNRDASSLAGDFVDAVRIARSGRRGPVHLSLPVDSLEAKGAGAGVQAADFGVAEAPFAEADADAALARLLKAQRPLILVGPGFCTGAGRSRVAALADATAIPVVCMESPRGVGDPSLGAFAQRLADADCILLLGKRLDFTLKFGRAPAINPACEFLQVDAEAEEIERTRRNAGARLVASWVCEPHGAAEALSGRAALARPSRSAWAQDVHDAVVYRPAAWTNASSAVPGRMHPVQALRPLQALLDAHPDSVFVSDGGEIGQWAQACLSAPHRVINGVAGSIGAALPFALAARLARPGAPVIAVMGDGTFGFHPAEIDTAVRYGLPFVVVVGNDARWNAEYQIQVRDYGPDRVFATELLPARYDKVAEAFGGYGELVTDPREVLPAAKRALASGLPAVLNVMIEGLAAPNIRSAR